MRRIATAIAVVMITMTACAPDVPEEPAAAESLGPIPAPEPEPEGDDCDDALALYSDAREQLDETPDNMQLLNDGQLTDLESTATRASAAVVNEPSCFTVEQRADAAVMTSDLKVVLALRAEAATEQTEAAPTNDEPQESAAVPEEVVVEPEPEVHPEPAPVPAPDPARVRLTIRTTYNDVLGRSPDEAELSTSADVWYGYWEDGRDADAAWTEWFLTNYQGEINLIADKKSATAQRDAVQNGIEIASCMANPDGYNCP